VCKRDTARCRGECGERVYRMGHSMRWKRRQPAIAQSGRLSHLTERHNVALGSLPSVALSSTLCPELSRFRLACQSPPH